MARRLSSHWAKKHNVDIWGNPLGSKQVKHAQPKPIIKKQKRTVPKPTPVKHIKQQPIAKKVKTIPIQQTPKRNIKPKPVKTVNTDKLMVPKEYDKVESNVENYIIEWRKRGTDKWYLDDDNTEMSMVDKMVTARSYIHSNKDSAEKHLKKRKKEGWYKTVKEIPTKTGIRVEMKLHKDVEFRIKKIHKASDFSKGY